MKSTIKKLIPDALIKWYRNQNSSKFKGMSTSDVFTEIYQSNQWRSSESISGTGSENKQTETLIKSLDKLFADLQISSVLDLPCGDFNWMQRVNLSQVNYTGADIVQELIESNRNKFAGIENVNFRVLNLISDPLPATDLIMVRDCMVHLSFEDIHRAIKNIKSSGSKFLLATTFTDHKLNRDIVTGFWRPINLQEGPFHFPAPMVIINENCTEGDGEFKDKSMALWEISKI